MRASWEWLILFSLATVLLIVVILIGDIFPNAALTWSLRIIGLFIILGLAVIYRRRKLKNL